MDFSREKKLRSWANGNYQYRLNLETTWRPFWKEQLALSLAWLPTRISKNITLSLSLPGCFQSQRSFFLNDDTWPAGRPVHRHLNHKQQQQLLQLITATLCINQSSRVSSTRVLTLLTSCCFGWQEHPELSSSGALIWQTEDQVVVVILKSICVDCNTNEQNRSVVALKEIKHTNNM